MKMTRSVIAISALVLGGLIGFTVKSKTSVQGGTVDSPVNVVPTKENIKTDDFKQPTGYSLTPEIIDFGKVKEGQALDVKVVLKHPGNGDVRIGQIKSTCPCVNASAETMIIPADEDGTIKINYHSLTASGSKRDHFFVELLKPEKVTLRGTVKGIVKRVPSQVMVEPSVIHFGSVSEKQTRTVKVWNLTKRSIRVTVEDVGTLACDSLGTGLTALPGKPVEIEVVADPDKLGKGTLNGKLKVSTSSDLHRSIAVPFDGTVR